MAGQRARGELGGPPGRSACGSFSQQQREGSGRFSVEVEGGGRDGRESASAEPAGCRGGRARQETGEGPQRPPCEPWGDRDGLQLGGWRKANGLEIHPGARLSEGVQREANHLSFFSDLTTVALKRSLTFPRG